MKNYFKQSTIALSVALLMGSGAALAADATGPASGPGVTGNSTADSLNTAGIGPTNVGNGSSTTTITGGGVGIDVDIHGDTRVNDTLDVTGSTTLGGSLGVTGNTSLNGANNFIGNVANTSTNTMRGTVNTITGTTSVNATGGTNSKMDLDSTSAKMSYGTGATQSNMELTSGHASLSAGVRPTAPATPASFLTYGAINSYSSAQAAGSTYQLLNPNATAASNALVSGKQVTNIITGHTLIDGDVYINGTLNYSSSSSALTTVSSGTSILAGATQATTGELAIANMGQHGAIVDRNGKITMGTIGQSTAALTLTNGHGATHGFVVNEDQATMSGGTRSSSLTLNNDGARFSNTNTGGPIRVTGVDDGRKDYDAVNYRQLKSVKAGVAGIAAMGNIPQVEAGKKAMLGVGLGHFDGSTALSVGGSYRMTQDSIIKASISSGIDEGRRNSTVFGVGAGFSW